MVAMPPAPLPHARELFVLDPAVAHLNHGSFGAVTREVREARRALMDEHDSNPLRFVLNDLWGRIGAARDQLAAFVGTVPEHSALVVNATHGVALALQAVAPESGDEIVLTDHSYHAVTLAAMDLMSRKGVKVVYAPMDLESGDADATAAVLSHVTDRTRLVIVDQISSATAHEHPVAKISAELRARGIPLLVDAAHAPGMVPVAAQGIDADFWVGNLHKWAFAPGGTAMLQVAPQWHERLVPLVISHGQPFGFPFKVEQQATKDYSAWLAAPTGLKVFARYGEEAVRRHNIELAAYGQRVIGEALGLPGEDLPYPGPNVCMRVIRLPEHAGTDFEGLRNRIGAELATDVAINLWRGRLLLRISAQIYNRAEEYERLAEGLPALLHRAA